MGTVGSSKIHFWGGNFDTTELLPVLGTLELGAVLLSNHSLHCLHVWAINPSHTQLQKGLDDASLSSYQITKFAASETDQRWRHIRFFYSIKHFTFCGHSAAFGLFKL